MYNAKRETDRKKGEVTITSTSSKNEGGSSIVSFGHFSTPHHTQPVAIKRFKPLAFRQEDYQNEKDVLTHCSNSPHRNVLQLIDTIDSHYWLILEKGFNELFYFLAQEILSTHTRLNIGLQILQGLEYLHNRHIIHRDIKAENVILFMQGPFLIAKIADFNSAVIMDEAEIQQDYVVDTDQIVGTLEMLAPEVFRDIYYKATDIFALGVLLGELIAKNNLGVTPFREAPKGRIHFYHEGMSHPLRFTEPEKDFFAKDVQMRPSIDEIEKALLNFSL